ncbi:MAG: glycosyltransferase, partial [Candidatus Omnitrophica bacterium]|nr:glycosyltransferase [Candidatus Omnitrophota bacterium]
GLDIVINAAKLLKDKGKYNIKFLLIGSGAVKDDLQKKAVKRGLDNVIFAGRQDKAMIPDFISMSDVCLVHLKKRNVFKSVLPSKIFEAAAMQKPIILGVEGFAERLVRNENMGVCIEPENPEQLISALEELAGNKGLAKLLGESGYRYVMNYHDYDYLANKYLSILNSVGR